MAKKKDMTLKYVAIDNNFSKTTVDHMPNNTRYINHKTHKNNYMNIKNITYIDNKYYIKKTSIIKPSATNFTTFAIKPLFYKVKNPYTKITPKTGMLDYKYVNRF
jgi:hypothetical protein